MKKSLCRGLIAFTSFAALASCQDYEGGFNLDQIKKASYAKDFEKTFGTPDPNQDWSMATLVKANVNLPGLSGTAKMNICTGDPRNAETRLLAQIMLKDGQGSIDFDAIKGVDNVFVTVEQDGQYKVFSQYPLQNGMLNIGNISPETLLASAPMTRAFDSTCPTTQSTAANRKDVEVDYSSDHQIFDCMKIRYPDTGTDERTLEKWIADTKAFVNQHNGTQYYPFTDESVRHFAIINGVDVSNSSFTLKGGASTNAEVYIKYDPWNNGGILKSISEWKSIAIERGENLKNNNGDFPFEISSVMVYEPFTDQWNNTYDVFKGFDWSNPVLKSGATEIPVGSVITYNGTTKSSNDWHADLASNASSVYANTYDGPWENAGIQFEMTNSTAGTSGALYLGIFPESEWVLKSNAKEVPTYKTVKVKLQYLDNVQTSPAPAWDAPLGYSFFGPGSFFAESVAYYTDGSKLNKYYTLAEMSEMEKGFCIKTTSTGPIELPYIFGCTDYSNQFGYIYWKDGDELKPDFNPYELKHFVLIEDARPQSNIHKESTAGDAVGPKELGTWDANLSGEWMDVRPDQYEAAANHSFIGTTYRVMYFGDDYSNTTGTYDFPAGYRIAFFITTLSTSNTTASDEEKLFTTHHEHGSGTRFNYSLPEFNEGLNHLNTKRPGGPAGMVKCIVWNHDGNTYMGFGDNSGDEDLNDIVFLVKGNFTPTTNIIKVAPIKWHMNYEGKHHDGNNDTRKDDDLYFQESKNVGGTYSKPNGTPTWDGHTFKGWAKTPTISSASELLTDEQLTNVTVENETGMCYFAIWDDTPSGDDDKVTVKWHKNLDGKHHDGTNSTSPDDDLQCDPQHVAKGSKPTKPATDPLSQTGKQFLGWAETPEATTALTDEQLAAIVINTDKCFYAVYGNAPTPPGSDPEPISWIFACEDLGGSFDYDFNDVVWEVKYAAGATTAQVKLLAAGGTLPFTLSYNGTTITTKGAEYASTAEVYISQEGSLGYHEFTVPSTWSVEDNKHLFTVAVDVEGTGASTIISAYQKDATKSDKSPQVLLLPGGWQWPAETQNIGDKYPSFKNWVAGNGDFDWSNVK